MEYTAHQVAERLGLTVPALHYYEKAGLLPPVKRNAAGHRVYTGETIDWLNMVVCLREADLPVRDIRKYVELLLQGPDTIPERQKLILQYRKAIEKKMMAMETSLHFFDAKSVFYQKILESGQDIPCRDFTEEWELFKQSQTGGE